MQSKEKRDDETNPEGNKPQAEENLWLSGADANPYGSARDQRPPKKGTRPLDSLI